METYCPKGKKVFGLNDRTRNAPYEKVGWETTDKLQDCGLVVEDLIGASNSEIHKLKNLLSYSMHHLRVSPIVCICHSIQRNNIHPILQMFDMVYVSAVNTSSKSMDALLRFYQIEEKERDKIMTKLSECGEKGFNHFVIDIGKKLVSFNALTDAQRESIERQLRAEGARGFSHEEAARSKAASAKASAVRFLGLLPDKKKEYGAFMFGMIYDKFSESIDPDDLTMSISRSVEGKKRTVKMSLVDLLFELLDESGRKSRGRKKLGALFSYVREKVVIPNSFILNKDFLASASSSSSSKTKKFKAGESEQESVK